MERSLSTDVRQTKEILGSIESLFTGYNEQLKGLKHFNAFVNGKDAVVDYFLRGNRVQTYMAREMFRLDGGVAALNADFWSRAIEKTDVLDCMPAAKRSEWGNMIHELKTPEFTRDNVISTLTSLLMQRESFFTDRVDGLFKSLSGSHVTNSPMAFRNRLIIEYMLDNLGYVNHTRAEYVHDLRVVIAKIMGRDGVANNQTRSDLNHIRNTKKFGEWFEFDGGAFKIRLYKKGTAHMEITQDIADRLNLILASRYPSVIAARTGVAKKQVKKGTLRKEFLSLEVLNILCKVAEDASRGRTSGYFSDWDDYMPSIKDDVEKVVKFLGGDIRGQGWYFPHDIGEAVATIVRTGCLPDKVSHQFYPTPAHLANRVVIMADIMGGDRILEPSAGHGALVDSIARTREQELTCIEVSSVNAQILRSKGYHVIEGDFLEEEHTHHFNRIIMNPPFTKGAAVEHVEHAAEFLADKGRLVAILPASLKDKPIMQGPQWAHEWSEVISGAFADTGVSVVILTLDKE